MRKILKLLNEITVEELAQTALTLSQFCKDPRFTAEQKKNNPYDKVMDALPEKINKLITLVGEQEIELIDIAKQQLIFQGKSLFDLGIDDVMRQLAYRMPNNLTPLDYSISAKAAILTDIISEYFGKMDAINEKIVLPLDKIANAIQAKRHELIGLNKINANIDQEAESTIDSLRKEYGYWQKNEELECLYAAIGAVSDQITRYEQNKADPADLEEFRAESIRLSQRRQEVFAEIAEIENKVKVNEIYRMATVLKAQNEKEETDKETNQQLSLRHEIELKKEELAYDLIIKVLPRCKYYKNYLEKILIDKLSSENDEVAKFAMTQTPLILSNGVKPGPRGIELLAPFFGDNAKQELIESTLPHTIYYDMGVDKYKSMCALVEPINPNLMLDKEQRSLTAFQQVNEFYDVFFQIRDELEKPRDNLAVKLAKFICSVITAGHGIPWINKKPEGEKLVNTIERISFWKTKPEEETEANEAILRMQLGWVGIKR